MNKPPIFIVGVQRSGTTLLAAQLAAHSKMSCGPETHFFRWLAQVKDVSELCSPETWPEQALQFVCGIDASTYSPPGRIRLIEKYGVTETEVANFLRQRKPSVASLLGSITVPYMERMGKQRWVEKTPDHIAHVSLIRQHFPDSPIIRIVRDPRDVALSLCKVPWGAQTFSEGLMFWKKLHEASTTFFDNDQFSYTLRFEDLILSPIETLRTLCAFIDEEFEEQMLDTSRTGKEVNRRNAAWKDKASQPIDHSRVATWRTALSDEENQLAEALVGDYLERYEYPRLAAFAHFAELYPPQRPTNEYTAQITELARKGIRFWRMYAHEKPAVRVYLGHPGEQDWLGNRRVERVLRTAALSKSVVQARLLRKRLFWISPSRTGSEGFSQEIGRSGICAHALQWLLGPYRLNRPA